MTKIKETSTLKQYNLNYSKKSNLIDEKSKKNLVENATASELINKLNLENNKLNKAIITELLKLNLPLKKELVSELNQFLTQFAESNNESLTDKIKTFLLLKELELPLNIKFYDLFKEQTNLTANLKDSFEKLLIQLNETDLDFDSLGKEFNNSEKSIEAIIEDLNFNPTPEEKELLLEMNKFNIELTENNLTTIKNNLQENSTDQLLKRMLFSKNLEDFSTDNLTKLVQQIDWSPDDNLIAGFEKLINLMTTSQADINFSNIISPNFKIILKENPELLITLKENLPQELYNDLQQELNLSTTEEVNILREETKNLLEETVITSDNLSSKKISNTINKLSLNDNQTTNLLKFLFQFNQSSPKDISEGEKLLKQLTSLQALNHSNDNFSIFLPLLFQNDLNLAHIKITKEAKKEAKEDKNNNSNPLNFSINFQTEQLGLIKATIKIKNKKIWAQFKSDQAKTVDLINQHLDKFKTKLEANNYQVRALTCNLATDNSTTSQQLKLTTIDLKI
ncbi:flagellar hook-length control protein FliK [Natroniella sulfidigena]|uniref:flagellar hook-length control protein FliK n=1 Tax=Natroniella sulfidigena TaxID=723921 RepID=UPI00200B4330|nr:flagellar hook-length control protein FliK [Natroniella sulfidigena]MCK8817805.1 flagellar hook-length control protein FliK [Natroniella sulfidigena]